MGYLKEKMIDYLFFGPWTWIFFILEIFVPVNRKTVLFGSNHGMQASDNSYALFKHIILSSTDLSPIWITRKREVFDRINEEFPGSVVMSLSIRGFVAYLRSQQVVVSHSYLDMCLMPYSRKKIVNYLWHGVPVRKIGKMLKDKENHISKGILKHWQRWNKKLDYFFASNEYEAKIMQEAFHNSGFETIVSGYPRNDILKQVGKSKKKREVGEEFTILYAPTYRILSAGRKNNKIPIMHPDVETGEMEEFLERNNARLIIRPHPLIEKMHFDTGRIDCVTVAQERDIANLFLRSDLFVTDYSSAYFDWLILGRPVLFSVYDLEEYSEEVGLINNLQDIAAGDIVQNKKDLFESLEKALSDSDESIARLPTIERIIGSTEGLSCPKIARFIQANSDLS